MSARLIGELTEWLLTPAAADLTSAERNVLFVVAERSHEKTRIMLRHRGDELQLVDRIAQATGLARDGALKKAFQRLAKRGLDVRIPVAEGKDGRPVFAHEGHSMRFRLPEFPAMVAIPERPADPVDDTPGRVDEAVDNSADQDPEADQRGDESSRLSTRGGKKRPASQPQRGEESSRPTPSNYLDPSYKQGPSTSVRSHGAEVEAPPTGPDETTKTGEIEFDYASACAYLLTTPGHIQTAAIDAAAQQLGSDAEIEELRIRAAQIAAKGIPA